MPPRPEHSPIRITVYNICILTVAVTNDNGFDAKPEPLTLLSTEHTL